MSQMIKVSNNTRSRWLIDKLNEADTDYAYIDDPCNRWIIYAGPYRQGFGTFSVYFTDKNNVAVKVGDAFFGYQDTVRHIINRSATHSIILDPPVDLNPQVCP